MRINIKQEYCRNTADHHRHGVTVTGQDGSVSGFVCPGRHTPSLHRAPRPSPTTPSDPFAGIDENTEYDATRPGAS